MFGTRRLGWVRQIHRAGAAAACALAACAAAPPRSAAPAAAVAVGVEAPSDDAASEQARALPARDGNPFIGARIYINPDYTAKLDAAARTSPAQTAALKKLAAFPTAIWVESIATLPRVRQALDGARRLQDAGGEPVVTVFVIYNLPNRDCAAEASAGELTVEKGGETRYRAEFIDKIAAELNAHRAQRTALLLEPDSLANLATNLNVPKCAASEAVYRRSISYAVAKLAMPHVSIYLDAAHAGWMGWQGSRTRMVEIYKDVLTAAGGADKIRGFVTNVANYNVLKGDDNLKLEPTNPCPDESTYVHELAETLMWAGITHKGYIIDTSRNGRGGVRTKWGNWCNVKGAGIGERPRAAPTLLIDAYLWVKPPGESDGTADPAAPRFDPNCRSEDAAPGAPQAGEWFPAHANSLVQNAQPGF